MPCFFIKVKVKEILNKLEIENIELLYQEMLKRYSDEELHQMSEEDIIELILQIWREKRESFWLLRKSKKKTLDVELIYR